jgi:hypothetical protein
LNLGSPEPTTSCPTAIVCALDEIDDSFAFALLQFAADPPFNWLPSPRVSAFLPGPYPWSDRKFAKFSSIFHLGGFGATLPIRKVRYDDQGHMARGGPEYLRAPRKRLVLCAFTSSRGGEDGIAALRVICPGSSQALGGHCP